MTPFLLFQSLKSLFSTTLASAQDGDAQYLDESTDIYELEYRMRQLDSGRHSPYSIGAYGIQMS